MLISELSPEFAQKFSNYRLSVHARDRSRDRMIQFLSDEEILNMVQSGQIILERDDMRYVQYGEYYFPCALSSDGSHFVVKTILTEGMDIC